MVLNSPDCQMLFGKIMHHRFLPKENKFLYSLFYMHINANLLDQKGGTFLLGINRPALFSLYAKDHGTGDKKTCEWLDHVLATASLQHIDRDNISLITLPRIMGFVFNPVSFWICHDTQKNIQAVICEVNNTFGESHTYICLPEEGSFITPNKEITAKKLFHVSPFLQREGFYKFRFLYNQDRFASFIDYYGEDDQRILATSIAGSFTNASPKNVIKAFLLFPLATIQVLFLIHWQAIKIFFKGISYVPKPPQNSVVISQSISNHSTKH